MSRKACLFLLLCTLHLPFSQCIFQDLLRIITDDHDDKGRHQPEVCQKGDVSCKNSHECIHKSWLCDGHKDCKDGSDEEGCRTSCSTEQFQCDQNRCVPLAWRCDGQKDCLDYSDEDPQACRRVTCPLDHFRCKSGECLPEHWKCDGGQDCKDGDDEDAEMCAKAKQCFPGERACKKHKCISASLWCDGRADCPDGSDEASCSPKDYQSDAPSTCNEGQFRCGNGKCIPEKWLCDKWNDCENHEDEQEPECLASTTSPLLFETFSPRSSGGKTGGPTSSCKPGDFTCRNGECIPANWRCDSNKDCEDGSDEEGCDKPAEKFLLVTHVNSTLRQSQCFHEQFACLSPSKAKICLPLKQICDKKIDCLNGTDEGPGCAGACKNDNGECSHICNPTPTAAVCSCPFGFALLGDLRTCVDVDECRESPCDQKCTNLPGSYKCECVPGFVLEKDLHRCKSDAEPFVLFSCDQHVRLVTMNGERERLIVDGNDHLVVGLDYAQENGSIFVFYADEERHRLSVVKAGQLQNQERLILDKIKGVEAVAYDWVAKNLYFVDRARDQIGICALGRSLAFCTQLMTSQARAITVHPGHHMLFLGIYGSDGGRIERTFLDGSDRRVVLDKKLLWPNFLTIDFVHERLYFADAEVNFLESCMLNGEDRRTVFHLKSAKPYGLSVYNRRLFYTEWNTQSIMTVLTNGSQSTKLFSTPRKPMSLIIMHESRQPNFDSVCKADKNPCQHICVVKAGNKPVCLCHEGYKPNADGVKCDAMSIAMSTLREEAVEAPRSINFTNGAQQGKRPCKKKDRTADEVCICLMGKCFWEPIAEDVKVANARGGNEREHGEELGGAHAEPSVHRTSVHASEMSRYSAATLAGIICACLVSVMSLLLIVFLLRKYKPHLMDPYSDEKSLLDEVDSPTRPKQYKPSCPSVGASFNNPTYENVTPGSSAYMVKFYKSGYNRIASENRPCPATPASSAQTV